MTNWDCKLGKSKLIRAVFVNLDSSIDISSCAERSIFLSK